MNRIQLSEHFTYHKLLRFVLPSIIMMIFTSIYGVVDGLFVSNYVGKTPFAAVNLIFPVIMLLGAIGFMIGTGGSAIVSTTMGEGDNEKANQYFSMLVYITFLCGFFLTVIGLFFIRPIAIAMGAEGSMVEDCVCYARILLMTLPAFMLQNVFQSFFVTSEQPKMGLAITLAAGFSNIVLDYLFIVVFQWGLAGAALATAFSQIVGGVLPILYFARKNSSVLRLVKTRFYARAFLKTCVNGSSELLTNISMSLVNILYNYQLLYIAGEDGVAAYGVIMYINFIFIAIFMGYSIGTAPIISYHYGAENHAELKNLYKKSLKLIGICGFVLTFLAIGLSSPLSKIFVGYDEKLFEMTKYGFQLYSLSFLVTGFSIFGSGFFTALNNGIVSGTISFLRTLVFQIAAVLILPLYLGIDGIWLAIVAAELLSLLVAILFFITQKKRYRYA